MEEMKMKKSEIKKATDNELIVDFIETYSSWCLKINRGGGTKQCATHCRDLAAEMLKRGIFTEENVRRFTEE